MSSKNVFNLISKRFTQQEIDEFTREAIAEYDGEQAEIRAAKENGTFPEFIRQRYSPEDVELFEEEYAREQMEKQKPNGSNNGWGSQDDPLTAGEAR